MKLQENLNAIVNDPVLHSKWLNTLSFMENAGARKISASESKEDVDIIVLKHAAEEHRHAYYLKKQIAKIDPSACKNYYSHELLAPRSTRFYLHKLDILVCRYLKATYGISGEELKFAAYLFVTYAIEVRADELYPIYQDALDAIGSKVNVKSIIMEEEGHLEEMISQLERFDDRWQEHAAQVVQIESQLFDEWMADLSRALANEATVA